MQREAGARTASARIVALIGELPASESRCLVIDQPGPGEIFDGS